MVQAEAVLNMPPTGIKTYVHKSAQGQTVNNTIMWFYFIIFFSSLKRIKLSILYFPIQQPSRSALQVLHKACEVSRRYNYFPGGMALTWMGYYESCIASDQSCINEWNAMKDLETTRPDSPTMFVDKSVNTVQLKFCWNGFRFFWSSCL